MITHERNTEYDEKTCYETRALRCVVTSYGGNDVRVYSGRRGTRRMGRHDGNVHMVYRRQRYGDRSLFDLEAL